MQSLKLTCVMFSQISSTSSSDSNDESNAEYEVTDDATNDFIVNSYPAVERRASYRRRQRHEASAGLVEHYQPWIQVV